MIVFWFLLVLGAAATSLVIWRPAPRTWFVATILTALGYAVHFYTLTRLPEAVALYRWSPLAYLAYAGYWVASFAVILDTGLRLWLAGRWRSGRV